MFNDLLEELNIEDNEIYAYADDLAINNIGKEKLHKSLDIIES